MKYCKICKKELTKKQKKYCSVDCQYKGYKQLKIERIEKKCLYCKKIFYIKPNDLKYGRGKYCSRKCNDIHKKETFSGEGNPAYGKSLPDYRKKQNSDNMKKLWKTDEWRKKYILGIERFIINNGYYPGTDNQSKEKRKETMVERYGIEHNWNGIFGERDCDKTTIDKYGKSSIELRQNAITLDVIEKRKKSIIKNYTGMSYNEYMNKLSEKEKYYKKVLNITKKQPIKLLENYKKRGRAGIDGAYHLDHIIPIIYGFINDIPSEIIGDISNLQFITWEDNLHKGISCEKI